MSILFLFGAGASYGSGDCRPKHPPLGNGENGLFLELLKKDGVTTTFDKELRNLFVKDFEEGMARFEETREIEIPVLLREMGQYFLQFEPGPNNLYFQLVQKLSERQLNLQDAAPRIVLATTNYELLIEHAVINSGGMVAYPDPEHEYDSGFASLQPFRAVAQGVVGHPIQRDAKFIIETIHCQFVTYEVLKLHGSCNFFPNIDPESMRGNIYHDNNGPDLMAPALPLYPPSRAWDYLERSDASIAPAIAMYAEGKRVRFSDEYVREHQGRFQAAVEKADRIFLVGIRVWPPDSHIWDHIAASNAWLGYVGLEGDAATFRSWCEEKGRTNHRVLAHSFKDALPLIEQELENVPS